MVLQLLSVLAAYKDEPQDGAKRNGAKDDDANENFDPTDRHSKSILKRCGPKPAATNWLGVKTDRFDDFV